MDGKYNDLSIQPTAPQSDFLGDAYNAVGGIGGIVGIVGSLVYTDEEKARDEILKYQLANQNIVKPAPADNSLYLMIGGGVLVAGLLGFAIFKLVK